MAAMRPKTAPKAWRNPRIGVGAEGRAKWRPTTPYIQSLGVAAATYGATDGGPQFPGRKLVSIDSLLRSSSSASLLPPVRAMTGPQIMGHDDMPVSPRTLIGAHSCTAFGVTHNATESHQVYSRYWTAKLEGHKCRLAAIRHRQETKPNEVHGLDGLVTESVAEQVQQAEQVRFLMNTNAHAHASAVAAAAVSPVGSRATKESWSPASKTF